MSDLQVLLRGGVTWFAANSDREPSEPQHVVRIHAVENDDAAVVDCTHIQVQQTARRHALILSKPDWTWGGEIGVNDRGIAIGSAAVPTRLVSESNEGLLGGDLVRLALERAYNAEEAVDIIGDLLEEYGQGGAAGHRDKAFRCDSVFLIGDREQAWLMETAGNLWAARCIGRHSELLNEAKYAAVSNQLSITGEFDRSSRGLEDQAINHGLWDGQGDFSFKEIFSANSDPFFAGAEQRKAIAEKNLAALTEGDEPEIQHFFQALREHESDNHHFSKHDNEDICRHAGGKSRPAQTCGSMVARLIPRSADDYLFTGSSAPCMSIFKPVDFNFSVAYHFLQDITDQESRGYWHRSESLHRRALFHPAFYADLQRAQREVEDEICCWLNEANPMGGANYREADQITAQWHATWCANAQEVPLDTDFLSFYGAFWKNLNKQDLVL